VDECKPLTLGTSACPPYHLAFVVGGRGLHSSTFRLNLSRF